MEKSMKMWVRTKLPMAHRVFPTKLFRVNVGPTVALREWTFGTPHYDVKLSPGGLVSAKYFQIQFGKYKSPNGATMRPNSPMLHAVLTKHWMYKDLEDLVIYEIAEGTDIPDGLILVHERGDFYSLQGSFSMRLKELNSKINEFLQAHAVRYTKQEFLKAYPEPIKICGTHIVRSIINPGKNNKLAETMHENPRRRDRWKREYLRKYIWGSWKGPAPRPREDSEE